MTSLALSKQLLWKDYRQLRPALIGCWAIMATILLLICVRQLLDNNRETIFPDAIMLVLAAPTLAAMAASGILIGHERQTRTWNWSSSLPIPWASSLVSKSLVWLVSSAAMVGTLYLLFLFLLQLCRMQGFAGDTMPDWISPQIVFVTVLVVPLIVYVCFSLAALLWNDTLGAFVAAAIIVAVVFLVASDLLPRILLGIDFNRPLEGNAEALGLTLEILLLVVIAGVFMVRAYHWRWTTGQLASIGWAERVKAPISSVQRRVIWQSVAWSGGAPSEFRMLLAHGFTQSIGTRLLILAATFVMGILTLSDKQHSAALFFAVVGSTLMGVTVFSGDQIQSAYKFFADRGVDWRKLLLAHTLPPLFLALLPVLIAVALAAPEMQHPAAALAPLSIAVVAFAVGLFCSLCSRLSLLSICMAVGGLLLATTSLASLHSFWQGSLASYIPVTVSVLIVLAETIVLLIGVAVLVRRWLIHDRVWGIAYYVATLCLAIVPAHLLAICFCFLTIPNVPWEGLEENQIQIQSQLPRVELNTQLPLTMTNQLYSYDPARLSDSVEFGYLALQAQLGQEGIEETKAEPGLGGSDLPMSSSMGSDAGTDLETVQASLRAMEADLDRLGAGPKVVVDEWNLTAQIESTAWLGAYATQKLRDLEFARRAWKVNRQLLTLIDYSVLNANNSLNGRLTSVLLRKHLKSDDWKFLETGGSLAELQPEPVSREAWTRLARMQATVLRQQVRINPVYLLLFPVRWYHERTIAFVLHQQIQAISGRPLPADPNVRVLMLQRTQPIELIISSEAQLPK